MSAPLNNDSISAAPPPNIGLAAPTTSVSGDAPNRPGTLNGKAAPTSGKPREQKPEPPQKMLDVEFSVEPDANGSINPNFTPITKPGVTSNVEPPANINEQPKEELDNNETQVEDGQVSEPLQEVKAEGTKDETVQPEKPKNTKRDLSGFDADEARFMKQMSNSAFDFLAARFKSLKNAKAQAEAKLKEAGQDIPPNYFNHPSGYTLSPKYGEISRQLSMTDFEASHYQEQYVKIKEGQNWRSIDGYTESGEPIFSEEYLPNARAEAAVMGAFQQVNAEKGKFSSQLKELKDGFKKNYDQEVSSINKVREDSFPWVKDEKLLDSTLEIPGKGQVPLRFFKEQIENSIPASMRDHPLAASHADLFMMLQVFMDKNRKLEQKVKVETKAKEQTLRAEPTATKLPSNRNSQALNDFDMSVFSNS